MQSEFLQSYNIDNTPKAKQNTGLIDFCIKELYLLVKRVVFVNNTSVMNFILHIIDVYIF